MEKIDLHLHTTYSDGDLDIATLLKEVKRRNIKTIAISDHETILGLNGYEKACLKYGIKIIPAIEMNVSLSGAHILGYGMDDFYKIESEFDKIRKENENIVFDIINLLKKDGIKIDESDVIESTLEYHKNKKNIVEVNSDIFKYIKEFIVVKTDIARTMMELGITSSIDESYRKYLGPNGKYFIRTKKIDTKDAIELIRSCNGVSVLAHPMTVNTRKESLVNLCKELKSFGLSGMEVNGPRYSKKQTENYISIARKIGFIETVGSDFHRYDQSMGIEASPKIVYNLEQKIKELKLNKHR